MVELHRAPIGVKNLIRKFAKLHIFVTSIVIFCIYIYIPGTCLSSILGFEPSKRRPKLHSKQGSFGFQVCIYIYIYISPKLTAANAAENKRTKTHIRSRKIVDLPTPNHQFQRLLLFVLGKCYPPRNSHILLPRYFWR